MPLAPRQSETASAWGAEVRACLALSAPLALTNAVEMAMNLTSLAVIGRVGPEALGASTLAMALYNVLLLFGIGVTAAVAPLVAREVGRGAGAGPAVRRIVQQGFWGSVIIAAPVWVVLWRAEAVLRGLGQDARLAASAAGYLHILQWSILPALVYLVLRSMFAALGRPRWALASGTAAVVLNALGNWLLVGGHAGLPAMGLPGSGLATLVANIFLAASLGTVATFDPRIRGVRAFTGLLRPDWSGFGAFWRLGLPIGVSLLLETGMFAAAAALVGQFGAVPLAAHAIALQVASFTFMVPLGIGQAATIRIGRASGAGDTAGLARAGWAALGVGLVAAVASATVLVAVPRAILDLFVEPGAPGVEAVEVVGVTLLGTAALFQVGDGAQVVLGGMLRGLGDTRATMVIAALGYWGLGIPLGALFAVPLGMGAPGVWLGMTAGLFAAAAMLLARWQSRLGRARRTLAPAPAPIATAP